jgi:hypothetical protein
MQTINRAKQVSRKAFYSLGLLLFGHNKVTYLEQNKKDKHSLSHTCGA